jgi:integrase/recombinase XerD
MKLLDAIEALCIATWADGRSDRTVSSYRQKLKSLAAFLGDVAVESVTVNDLRRYVASLRDTTTLYADHPRREERAGALSEWTIASQVRNVKRLFNWLEAEGVIEVNPARRIRTPTPRRDTPKGAAREDFLALLETTEEGGVIDLRDRAILFFLADTGCRVGGLCGLQLHDVDLVHRLAAVREKGGRVRLAPFTNTTARALREWLTVRPENKGEWFFVGLGNRSHDRMNPNGVAKMLDTRKKRAGVMGPVNPHSFRHAFAREFLIDGGDIGILSDLMGHSTITVTKDFYGIFTVAELQKKHAQHSPIAQIFGGDGGERNERL